MNTLNSRLSIAPMMDLTDRHCRYFHRQISQHTLLYTEMITTGALLHGDVERHLVYNDEEHPVALQLGGSEPKDLAKCAKLGVDYGYDEINLNCGCPSNRVQKGAFGACLMKEPDLVADCVSAMKDAVDIPVTVKCRIGVDDQDDYQDLFTFAEKLAAIKVDSLTVHARKAWLEGLSPKQNREVPPLQYDRVYQLKADLPNLPIMINGGIETISQAEEHLKHLDGVMIGRSAYYNPWLLADADARIFNDISNQTGNKQSHVAKDEFDLVERMYPYIDRQLTQGIKLAAVSRHLLGLFTGQPGARQFRRVISESAHLPGAGVEVIERALTQIKEIQQKVFESKQAQNT